MTDDDRCPFLKITYTAMNREIVKMQTCCMGIDSSRIPEHCSECAMYPGRGESL